MSSVNATMNSLRIFLSWKCTFCDLLMKSSFLSMNQGCGGMSCVSFPMECFPAHATAQGELHRVPFPGSGSSSSQSHLPQRTAGIWCGISSQLSSTWERVEGPHWAKWVSVICLLLPDTGWPNEGVCFITPHETQRRNVNPAIGKCIIDLMGKWICHHWWDISLPPLSSFLIYAEHKSLNFYGDMTQRWILAQAAQN